MSDQPATGEGWKTEDLHFRVVSAPDRFAVSAEGPVRYLRVERDQTLLGYLWFSDAEGAAGFAPAATAGREGRSAKIAWVQLLQQQKAEGLSPSEAVHVLCARTRQNPGAGVADATSIGGASTLAELRAVAASDH
ncbi:MAG: hypothetical protein IR160_05640 [Salinibacterium sp.]|nr:hypothetical protein [Salinibacterium sp.]MBF0672052.1 hypothetical protein [Salinibacterium sp.]